MGPDRWWSIWWRNMPKIVSESSFKTLAIVAFCHIATRWTIRDTQKKFGQLGIWVTRSFDITCKVASTPFFRRRWFTKTWNQNDWNIISDRWCLSFIEPRKHGVWESQKKSHSTLRAKRATFTFWVDKSLLKMPKMVHFGEFLKTWSLRSNSVTR